MRKTEDKICNTALFHIKLARPRSINVRIQMVYLDLLYLALLLRQQHIKCSPAADRLGCRISIKMTSQPCGGTTHNKPTLCVFSQLHLEPGLAVMLNVGMACQMLLHCKHCYIRNCIFNVKDDFCTGISLV